MLLRFLCTSLFPLWGQAFSQSLFLNSVPVLLHTRLWHYFTHPADHSGCVHWHRGGEHCAGTQTHTLSLHVSMSLSLLVSESEKPLGPWRRLYLAAAVPFFRRSDVSHGLPQLFYQVILSGRQPRTAALFILCYRDRKSRPPLWWHAKKGERLSATFTSAVTSAFPAAVIIRSNTGIINETARVCVWRGGTTGGGEIFFAGKWVLKCVRANVLCA